MQPLLYTRTILDASEKSCALFEYFATRMMLVTSAWVWNSTKQRSLVPSSVSTSRCIKMSQRTRYTDDHSRVGSYACSLRTPFASSEANSRSFPRKKKSADNRESGRRSLDNTTNLNGSSYPEIRKDVTVDIERLLGTQQTTRFGEHQK